MLGTSVGVEPPATDDRADGDCGGIEGGCACAWVDCAGSGTSNRPSSHAGGLCSMRPRLNAHVPGAYRRSRAVSRAVGRTVETNVGAAMSPPRRVETRERAARC